MVPSLPLVSISLKHYKYSVPACSEQHFLKIAKLMAQVLQLLSSFVLCQASREISIVVTEFDLCSRLHFHCKFHLFTFVESRLCPR